MIKNDHSAGKSYQYKFDRGNTYTPAQSVNVLPGRIYRLNITFRGNNKIISAQTKVPKAFRIIKTLEDTVKYEQVQPIRFLATMETGNDNAKYFFNVRSQDKTDMTSFYEHQIVTDANKNTGWYYNVRSSIINESNFSKVGGDIELRLPWDTIAFYGKNLVIANIIDNNLYDFLRSIGGSGRELSSMYTNETIYHINGGIGIFGSMARDSAIVNIIPEL